MTCRSFSALSPTTIPAPRTLRTRFIATASRPYRRLASPPAGFDAGDVEAIVVALKIRSVEAARAVAAATAAYDWLAARGARHVIYKICSTFELDRRRQHRAGRRGVPRPRQGRLHSRDARLSGDGTHRLSRASVRRPGSIERESAQGPSLKPDARFQSRARAQAPVQSSGRSRRAADRRRRRRGDCAPARRSRAAGLRRGDRGRGVRA